MSIYEELCQKYSDKRERDIEYARKSGFGAAQLASSFQRYIDAPQTYLAQDDTDTERQYRYIDVALVDNNWEITSRNYQSVKDMCFNQNGFLLFYLMVTLEMAPNAYPKMTYRIPCGIKPVMNSQYRVFIGRPDDDVHKEFVWNNGEAIDSAPVQYILYLLVSSLDRQPFSDTPLSE